MDNQYSYQKEELFNTLTDILQQFINYCRNNNLEYCAFAGTLLGAIRHQGIIPWDDDIDVVMLRKDYDKLLSQIEKAPLINGKYKFLNTTIDPYFPKGFTRLTNINTTEIPLKDAMYKYNHGCFIDIFPLDDIPDSYILRKIYFIKLNIYLGLLQAIGRYQSEIGTVGLPFKKRLLYYAFLPAFKSQLLTPKKVNDRLNSCASFYSYKIKENKQIGTTVLSVGNPRFIYNKVDYMPEYMLLPFEQIKINVPIAYDNILRTSYVDYMKPVKQPSEHGDTIIDVHTGYTEYINSHFTELQQIFERVKNTQFLKQKK